MPKYKNHIKKQHITVLLNALLILFFIIFIGPPQDTSQQNSLQSTPQNTTQKTQQDPKNGLYEVTKVIDGDTIDVLIGENGDGGGKTERVRLIGVNTPETVDPRKSVQCFGIEASEKAKSLLLSKYVKLERDATQANKDKYGRSLYYVFLEDGTNFNLTMIAEGYAYEYTYDLPYMYQEQFKLAEQNAKINKLGLWGSVCGQ